MIEPVTHPLNRRIVRPIDAGTNHILPCETRLALSASLAGDLILEALSDPWADAPGTQAIDLSRAPHVSSDVVDPVVPVKPLDTTDANFNPPSVSPDLNASPDLIDQALDLRNRFGLDGRGQTVAVIDSGVAWDHVALGGGYGPGYRVVGGWDFAENDADPYDDGPAGFHGTHVAGLLAGQTESFAGVAPASDIVALRVFDDNGIGQLQWIESALQWVHEHQDAFDSPITTVNLSVGAALTDANRADAMSMLEDELQLLRQDDILVFAASGNLFQSTGMEPGVLYPASSPWVTPVTSIDNAGQLSEFAQRDDGVFATRGESIDSSIPDHVFGWDGKVDDFVSLDGTSMATPQVTGASMLLRQAMLLRGIDPTPEAILESLQQAGTTHTDTITGSHYQTIDLTRAIAPLTVTDQMEPIERFDGSNQGEIVELDLRDGVQLRVGGVTYALDPSTGDQPFVVDVGGGNDTLRIEGSLAAERLIVRPSHAGTTTDVVSTLSTNDFMIELRGFENVEFRGGGGPDRATLFDSPGSDVLESRPGHATLKGVGFQFDVRDVSRVYVHANQGGQDTAFLHDGPGDDRLAVRPQFTSLRGSGTFQLANGFERVYAYANAGGSDSAVLYDSAGDDTMSISPERSMITGPGYHVSARGFESTEGQAIAGGHDVARIYADEDHSRWDTSPDRVQWTGRDDGVRIARGFERTHAFEHFRPIEIDPLSASEPIAAWLPDDAEDRRHREANAARTFFESFGKVTDDVDDE